MWAARRVAVAAVSRARKQPMLSWKPQRTWASTVWLPAILATSTGWAPNLWISEHCWAALGSPAGNP